ncbi:MAG: D-alanine--D-alanine ligase [Clostridia bacterium]|nr:D-alanine--D-alanine ligase [Clostridia bacterium]
MKIVVLCGGLSMERNVSLSSGSLICKALRKNGHKAILVDMFYGIENYDGDLNALFETLPEVPDCPISNVEPDLPAVIAARKWQSPSMIGHNVLDLCKLADVVFLGLHGACGEDGRIQAALDLLGIKYTGSGCLGSALAMDKHLTKCVVAPLGVKTPTWEVTDYTADDIDAIVARTKLPCVVKPIDSGSSIGVAIATDEASLRAALNDNLKLGRVMLEQYVKGRELDVGVLQGKALPSIEIIPKQGFYDYANKYQAGATLEVCPAPLDADTERRLGEVALTVHKALGLNTYSRSDYILDENGDIWFLEINTLPGMTPTSLLPQEAAAAGISYNELCEILIKEALEGKS